MPNTTQPTPSVETRLHRYQRATALEQACFDCHLARNTTLYPHWIGTDTFWYRRDTATGCEYRLVDAGTQDSVQAFDHPALATALAQASGESVDANDLPITVNDINLTPRQVRFTAFDQAWLYEGETHTCERLDTPDPSWVLSPNGEQAAFMRDHNLWVKNLNSGEERALTHDGAPFYVYASTPTAYGRQERHTTEVAWSPDGSRLLTLVTDTRQVKTLPSLLEHVPASGGVRPELLNADRRVAFPGDEHIEANYFLSVTVESGEIQRADYPACPVMYPPYRGVVSSHQTWWDKNSRRAYFIERERDGLTLRLLAFDTDTGDTTVLIEESTKADDHASGTIHPMPISHLSTLIYPLPETDELIWYSERNGWAHLYLYDSNTGALKNPITAGDASAPNAWLVRGVLHVDAARRELWIQTAGRVAGRNPYYCDICRVHLDTGELTVVVSTDDEYVACDPRGRVSSFFGASARGVSPSGDFVVTTRSRVDDAPLTMLLDRNGQEIMSVEAADLSGLPANWQWPEPVMLKAADGKTDIYSVVFRPSDYSEERSYPVLDCSYGNLTPVGAFNNNGAGSWQYLSAAALAELGFVVVMVATRGTLLRSKAFATDRRATLLDSPEDCISAIQQLAERYPSMDVGRVGIASWGSNPSAVGGLLRSPDFYKVGVTVGPLIDSRLTAQFLVPLFGANVAPEDDDGLRLCELAKNLTGKLFIIHGMLDDVIPVAGTFRLVEALQQANKDFDLLLLPTLGHDLPNYAKRRQWDYLVQHLQGCEPPKEFLLE